MYSFTSVFDLSAFFILLCIGCNLCASPKSRVEPCAQIISLSSLLKMYVINDFQPAELMCGLC